MQGNARYLPEDTTAPTATFTVPERAWAGEDFKITMDSYTDDETEFPDEDGVENLGSADGGETWQHFESPQFVSWDVPGPLTFKLQISDQSGNTRDYTLPTIDIVEDTQPPVVTLTKPGRASRDRIAGWQTLQGKATDNRKVLYTNLGVVQKRGAAWYAYDWSDKQWHKAGATEGSALRSRHYFMTAAPVRRDTTWTQKLAGLAKGTLVIRYGAKDVTGLKSPTERFEQVIKRG